MGMCFLLLPLEKQKILGLFVLIVSTNYLICPLISSDECEGDVIFSYPSFSNTSCESGGSLLCMGAVTPGPGYLNLTTTPKNASTEYLREYMNEIGRVLHRSPVQAWPATFCTSFTIRVLPLIGADLASDGMAFVMAQDNHSSPPSSFGSYLGLQDQKISGFHLSVSLCLSPPISHCLIKK